MPFRSGPLAFGVAAAFAAVTLPHAEVHACGGCFHPTDQPETTVVTAHRMALSISTAQTVLWDQVQYAGAPQEFAWVLPIKAGARLELSTDAWFEALDAATSTRVVGPELNCGFGLPGADGSGCGCGSIQSEAGADNYAPETAPTTPVTVVHEAAVGPYETVTLHATVPGALTTWLSEHGFAIDTAIQPIIDAYTTEGFDFIALRLLPGRGVQQMKPVRIVSEGAVPTLPLRMVSAGTGANVDLTLFVIGEGRWHTQNFPGAVADTAVLSWDFTALASNYSELRQGLLAESGGRTWLSSFAKQGALLSPLANPIDGSTVLLQQQDGNTTTTIAELYVGQGLTNGEAESGECMSALTRYADSAALVVNPCPDGSSGEGGAGGGSCGVVAGDEIDARSLACGKLDDMAVALTGTHPRDVWLTRLEAKLPHAALKDDLRLEASPEQTPVENWLQASKAENEPCPLAGAALSTPGDDVRTSTSNERPPRSRRRTEFALLAAGIAAFLAALLRRSRGYGPELTSR